VTALDPRNGAVLQQRRLPGAIDNFYASPVAADDEIFLVSQHGKVAVLKPDGKLTVLAVNDLQEDCYATPAIAGGRLYIRTSSTLYCFGR
jgi:outer membrane protein assembly factor BamB